jgi:heme exporter protein A
MLSGDTTNIAIEIIGVDKRYGHFNALRLISLKIEKGTFLALLGPNGAGKSTLLKIIATHIVPSSGTLKVLGLDASNDGAKIRKRVGFLAHENYLYNELTVKENLRFYADIFRVQEENFLGLVDALDLKRWYNVRVKNLSYGLKRRTDIVRALLHSPDVLLLDEPFSGLDAKTSDLLAIYLEELKAKKMTLFMSSHSSTWAEKICDRGVLFDKGKIVGEVSYR